MGVVDDMLALVVFRRLKPLRPAIVADASEGLASLMLPRRLCREHVRACVDAEHAPLVALRLRVHPDGWRGHDLCNDLVLLSPAFPSGGVPPRRSLRCVSGLCRKERVAEFGASSVVEFREQWEHLCFLVLGVHIDVAAEGREAFFELWCRRVGRFEFGEDLTGVLLFGDPLLGDSLTLVTQFANGGVHNRLFGCLVGVQHCCQFAEGDRTRLGRGSADGADQLSRLRVLLADCRHDIAWLWNDIGHKRVALMILRMMDLLELLVLGTPTRP